jgi:RNA polymerase sigma-70 factor (ECF subfamily)
MKVNKPIKYSKVEQQKLQSFQELFFKYHGRLVLFANKFTGDLHVSQDLVQDAFLKLWEKTDILSTIESPKAYLFQAVRNSCLNHRRHLNIKHSVEEELTFKIGTRERQAYSDKDGPMNSLLEMEIENEVEKIIRLLPEKCREVYTLSRRNFLKNKEIADKLGISVKMVEKHISRALAILRSELAEYLGLLLFILLNKL